MTAGDSAGAEPRRQRVPLLPLPPPSLNGVFFIMIAVAAYTVNDAVGVRIVQTPLAYALWLYPLSAVPTLLWLGRKTALRWPTVPAAARGLAGAAASIGAYALVLWAFTQAPVAPVAALRETSIPLGVMLARLLPGGCSGAPAGFVRFTSSLAIRSCPGASATPPLPGTGFHTGSMRR